MKPIEWVKNQDGTQGITKNSKTGCLNGCEYCYARKLANTRLRERYLANKNWCTATPQGYEGYPNLDPFYPRWWPERLEQIRKLKKPTGIFLNDMSDWMGDYWPEEWTQQELQVMRDCPQHRFYTLTKQPQNLPKWSPFPDNCWVGTTITRDSFFDNGLWGLLNIQTKKRYISFEPLLERINVTPQLFVGIDWVIIGAQTKPYKPPNPLWVHEIIVACREAGIPYFLKENLRKCLTVEAPYYRMPGTLIQKDGFSYRSNTPVLIQEMPK